MRPAQSRREFLEAAGTVTAAGLAAQAVPGANAQPSSGRPKVAAICTTYYFLSHAYHIVGRFIDGFPVYDRPGPYKPGCDVVSLFIEQAPEVTDLGRAKARKHGIRLSPTIADALTLGTDKLAVDAVLLIGEHGDYPTNAKRQKLYPRGRFFREIAAVMKASGRGVPVFNDKHLSYRHAEAQEMVDTAKALNAPFMAGSSLPVTWRFPQLEIPLGRPIESALVAAFSDIEIYGFHALETLQCMVERRDLRGKPQGVKAVTCLEGDAVWAAGDSGVWSWELLDHALSRSQSRNVGDIRQNVIDVHGPEGHNSHARDNYPIAFVVEYVDGLRSTALLLNGQVADFTFAAKLGGSNGGIVSTLCHLPAPPGARFFDPLTMRIDEFFRTGKSPYPVERTLLTGGILDFALESRIQGHKRVETPALAKIDYVAPGDSGFIRAPLTSDVPNRVG